MITLTQRQQQILDWIREYVKSTGIPPTRAELGAAMGFRSPNAAEDHLKALARKGAIELLAGASRGIRLKPSADETGLPLVGRVAAGSPILAAEHVDAHYRVDPHMFHPEAHYLLRIRGESMRDAGMMDGDLLAVHSTQVARDGQIIVARLGDEVTVKRFFRTGDQVRLQAENPDFQDILVNLQNQHLVVEGLGVGIIRTMEE